jgi:hypothetical protein
LCIFQEAKKWQERREALEALQKLAESPKIENGTFGTLVSTLLKVSVIFFFFFFCVHT